MATMQGVRLPGSSTVEHVAAEVPEPGPGQVLLRMRASCSGSAAAREVALRHTRGWGRCVFVGEGGTVSFTVSDLLIHKQISLHGSWVTSLVHMEQLLERLVRWDLHPEAVVTHRYALSDAAEAYRVADAGEAGKVCIVWED